MRHIKLGFAHLWVGFQDYPAQRLIMQKNDWGKFNDAHGFHSTPTIFEAEPTPNFASHTQASFTYTVGAGVQKALSQHWQIGVGYEFTDWGKSSLGRAAEQTLNQGLTLNHLYTTMACYSILLI